jgi:hypothetical protein
MLPNGGAMSVPTVQAPFIGPRNLPTTGVESWEIGGIALNNPSQGLLYQNWLAYIDNTENGNVYLLPDNGTPILFTTLPGITQLSLTFDQNMAPFLSYTQSGLAFFYWYDTTVNHYVTTQLETGAITPCCSLDDKDPLPVNMGQSDILLFYIVAGECLYRMQRERYGVIHTWDSAIGSKLLSPKIVTVGMNTQKRFQVLFQAPFAL